MYSGLFVNLFQTSPSKHLFVGRTQLAIPVTRDSFLHVCERSIFLLIYPFFLNSDNAIYDFSKKAVENGLDIFRVFDSLNYIGMLDCIKSRFVFNKFLDRECLFIL